MHDPALREESFDFKNRIRTDQVIWSADGLVEYLGTDPRVVFELKSPRHVSMARIRYSVMGVPPPLRFEAFWRHSAAGQEFTEAERYYATILPADPEERIMVTRSFDPKSKRWMKPRPTGPVTSFWVNIPIDTVIDAFRIDPSDQPCTFKIEEIQLVMSRKD